MGSPTSTPTLTWVGHSTLVVDADGRRLVTDPLLTDRVAHLRRRCPLPDPSIGDADVVLVSHAHMDHLHLPSLRRIRPGAIVVAPAGTARLFDRAGLRNVVEVAAGDHVDVHGFAIAVVPAEHPTGRGPHSRIVAAPVGFVITVAGERVYFPGDTDLFPAMADVGPVTVAALPIWGWGPTIGPGHLDPARAAQALDLVRPTAVVPIHWGTYSPLNGRRRPPHWLSEPLREFEAVVRAAGHEQTFRRLEPGESLRI